MNKIIETERLLLRPLTKNDTEDVFVWVSDPIVNKYMPYSIYTCAEAVRKWILSLGYKNEFGFELKETGCLIGSGSVGVNENNYYEIGYNIRANYWNKGYATETATALIRWAYDNLNAREFEARHATANLASGKVLIKCGFEFKHFGKYDRFDGSETFKASYYRMSL